MKLKFKLNVAAIKALAIQHGEKAGFFLGVCGLALFIWSAAKTDVLGPDKQPDKLGEAATKTDQLILNSKWDPSVKGIEVVDYVRRAKRDPLNDKDYRWVNPLNTPLWESKGRRPDPKLLPVEEMLASAGMGIFALAKEDDPAVAGPPKKPVGKMGPPGAKGGPPGGPAGKGGPIAGGPGGPPRGPKPNRQDDTAPKGVRPNSSSDLKGFSWVVITGLIPGRKQEAEFEEAFRNVIKPIPETDMPEYQGLKIERAEIKGGAAEPVWQEIKLKDTKTFKARWQAEAHEVVDEMYVDLMYTMPLAPLVAVDWDPAAVGHPKVQLAEKIGGSRQSQPAPSEESTEEDEDAGGIGGRPNQPDRFGAPPPMVDRKKNLRKGAPDRRQADVTLFRFIDFTVEPAKQYRYRVKLRLSNPNYGVTERYLRDPASRSQKSLYSPWSEPTPLVTVPRDVEVFAGPVVKASSKEPLIKVLITKLDREHGLKLVGEETFQRGSPINIRKKIETEAAPGNNPVEIDALLNSDSVIVDIEGGKPFKGPRSPTVPGEMVILQPDGSLVVRDELDDESSYRTNLPGETAAPAGASGSVLGLEPWKKGEATPGAPKKSKLETLKEEAAAKKQGTKKKRKSKSA